MSAVPSTTSESGVQHVKIEGFDNFTQYYDSLNSTSPPTYFYFSGKKDDKGTSWCTDCVESEPVVKNVLDAIHKQIVFAYVDVGDRDYWKNPQCPFRTDKRTKLMVIPTILKWNGVQRLEGSQCNKAQLIQMMFEEE